MLTRLLKMESTQANNKPSPKPKTKLILVAVIALVSVLLIGVAYGLIPNNASSNSSNSRNTDHVATSTPPPSTETATSWVTKGTYATYEGQAQILSINMSFNARMEVTDLNETHFQVTTSYDASTSYGSEQNSTTMWVNKSELNFMPEGAALNSTSHAQISLPGIGTRSCTLYEYSSEGLSAAYYVDDTYHWPIKVTLTSPEINGQTYNMDLSLKDTNIPGL